KVGVPTTLTIPVGLNYVYFNVVGKDTGAVTLTASIPGYLPTTATYRVSTPRVTMCCGQTLNDFGGQGGFTVYSTDSVGNGHYRTTPLVVSVVSSDTTVIRVDSSALTIGTGQYYNNSAHVTPVGVGTAKIVVTAPGHRPDSATWTVQTPKVRFSFHTVMLGRRQFAAATDFYFYTPDN